eukprot:NODE_16442_length_995_cov_1.320276.p5 GENE.NODE_16442_length_995_cov_1.320276~~NODE_16442_length_995_cov_1.320276.p5  ORF type:complete len:65 (-),score=6.30 NODE_16442_length_995_cov_1.320276:53-247(-)
MATHQHVFQFEPQSLANIAWPRATLGLPEELLADSAQLKLRRVTSGFRPLPITNLIWARATPGI